MKTAPRSLILFLAALLVSVPMFGQLTADATGVGTAPEDFSPPGTLYDNDVNNNTTSLASQDSTGTFTARTADDFLLDGALCPTGQFEITQIRAQIVQDPATPQAFAIDLFDDNGSGTSPIPTNAITPIYTFPETSQTLLGPFGARQMFEASFATPGLVLDADTVYWISGYGANGAANPASFNNFFAASNGAVGTTANGMLIAPGAGVATWTPVEAVIGGSPLAFSFAIDGQCLEPTPSVLEIPTVSSIGLALLALLLVAGAWWALARRRAQA